MKIRRSDRGTVAAWSDGCVGNVEGVVVARGFEYDAKLPIQVEYSICKEFRSATSDFSLFHPSLRMVVTCIGLRDRFGCIGASLLRGTLLLFQVLPYGYEYDEGGGHEETKHSF